MSSLGREAGLPEKCATISHFNLVLSSYLQTPGEELHEDSLFNNRDVLGVEHVGP